MEILGVIWMKNREIRIERKIKNRDIWDYEIIEKVNVLAVPIPKRFLWFVSQPWWSTRRATNFQDRVGFYRQGYSVKHFSYKKYTKGLMGENLRFFHLGTLKAAFLMRNLPIDTCYLGIFINKQGHSFQFPKKSRGGLPLLPG